MREVDGKKLIVILLCLHLAISLPLAYILNIWSDEASTLFTTEHGLFQTFQSVFADEKQAPLYFLLMSVWREISHSMFFARIFSVIFSLLAIIFFADLSKKFFTGKISIFLTAFFALHPYLIWASLEIRLYSLVILLSILLLKFFAEGYLEDRAEPENSQRNAQIFYILTAIAALYTTYYLGFLLAGNFLALVILRKWRTARIYFLQMLIVGAVILPLLWMLKLQLADATHDMPTEKTLAEGARIIWNSCLSFVFPTEIFPPEETTWISFFRLWLIRLAIFVGAVLLIRKRRIEDKNTLAFGVICATIAAFLLFAYFLLGGIYISVRHAAVIFVPLIFFAAFILKEIFSPKHDNAKTSTLLAFVFSLLTALLFAYSIYSLYPQAVKRGDWAHIAEYIQTREKPDQPIIVFTAFDALNLPYYYRGANRIYPDERFFNWGMQGAQDGAESLKAEIDFVISKIPSGSDEIFLVTNDRCQATKACEPLENFIEANYTITEEKDFYQEKVRLLRKKQK